MRSGERGVTRAALPQKRERLLPQAPTAQSGSEAKQCVQQGHTCLLPCGCSASARGSPSSLLLPLPLPLVPALLLAPAASWVTATVPATMMGCCSRVAGAGAIRSCTGCWGPRQIDWMRLSAHKPEMAASCQAVLQDCRIK